MAAAVFPTPHLPGYRLIRGDNLNAQQANPTYSSQQSVTAHAGGGRTAAVAISAAFTNVTVCATANDSVVLPAAKPGIWFLIANNGVASMQVFANGSDTINGTAGATGVAQAAGVAREYFCVASGVWLFNSTSTAATVTTTGNITSGGFFDSSVGNALTAAGTNQATALALTKAINNVTTAAASTGVALPAASTVGIGGTVTVFNAGANAITVYGAVGASDTIDTVAGATGVTLTNAKRCIYFCVAANTFISAQLGVVSA